MNKKNLAILLFISVALTQFTSLVGAASPLEIWSDFTFTGDMSEPIEVMVDNVVIDGNGYTLQGFGSGTGFNLDGRSNVIIKNVKIERWGNAISLWGASNTSIVGNTIVNNEYGIYLWDFSNFSSIVGNNITSNYGGIYLRESSNNSIMENTIAKNEYGIYLWGSSNNSLVENTLVNQYLGITLFGSSNNTIGRNIITNSYSGIYLRESSNTTITENTILNNIVFGITLYSSVKTWISWNNITNNYFCGIYLSSSTNNSIIENTIAKNETFGIIFEDSSNFNSIAGNTIVNNEYGIYLRDSSSNIIFHNDFIDNIIQAQDETPADNDWFHPELLEGNYWSDYPGYDDGSGEDKHAIAGDGIGDTHIPWLGPNYDSYPFIVMWDYVFIDAGGRETRLLISTVHNLFQFITPEKDYGIREATYMRTCNRTIFIQNKDSELWLISLVIKTKVDFCIAIAWNRETQTRYFLIAYNDKQKISFYPVG